MTDCRIYRSRPSPPTPITLAAALTGLTASIGEMVAGPARLVAEAELEFIASKIRALAVRINTPRKTKPK